MNDIYTRQNEKIAIMYRKASELCYSRERIVKYFVICLSVTLCILSIINRYSNVIFPRWTALIKANEAISKGLVLSSGIVMIFQILVNRYSFRLHIEGVNFEERYDNHVFLIAPNKSIMRPISDTNIELYASRITLPDEYFTDRYFSEQAKALEKNAQFKNYQKLFEDQYRLMLNVKGFFQTIWVGFIVLIVILAASFDVRFLETMTNIIIPSLSIISLIMSSWTNFDEQMRFLQNVLNVTKELEINADVNDSSPASLNSPLLLRSLQDSLFNMRQKMFDVPMFLIRRYEKRMARLQWGDEYEYHNRRFRKKQEKINQTVERTFQPAPIKQDSTITRIQKAAARLKRKNDRARLNLEDEPLDADILNEIQKPAKRPAAVKESNIALVNADSDLRESKKPYARARNTVKTSVLPNFENNENSADKKNTPMLSAKESGNKNKPVANHVPEVEKPVNNNMRMPPQAAKINNLPEDKQKPGNQSKGGKKPVQ